MKILLENIDQLTELDLLELKATSGMIMFNDVVIKDIEKRINMVNKTKEEIDYHNNIIKSYEYRLEKIINENQTRE